MLCLSNAIPNIPSSIATWITKNELQELLDNNVRSLMYAEGDLFHGTVLFSYEEMKPFIQQGPSNEVSGYRQIHENVDVGVLDEMEPAEANETSKLHEPVEDPTAVNKASINTSTTTTTSTSTSTNTTTTSTTATTTTTTTTVSSTSTTTSTNTTSRSTSTTSSSVSGTGGTTTSSTTSTVPSVSPVSAVAMHEEGGGSRGRGGAYDDRGRRWLEASCVDYLDQQVPCGVVESLIDRFSHVAGYALVLLEAGVVVESSTIIEGLCTDQGEAQLCERWITVLMQEDGGPTEHLYVVPRSIDITNIINIDHYREMRDAGIERAAVVRDSPDIETHLPGNQPLEPDVHYLECFDESAVYEKQLQCLSDEALIQVKEMVSLYPIPVVGPNFVADVIGLHRSYEVQCLEDDITREGCVGLERVGLDAYLQECGSLSNEALVECFKDFKTHVSCMSLGIDWLAHMECSIPGCNVNGLEMNDVLDYLYYSSDTLNKAYSVFYRDSIAVLTNSNTIPEVYLSFIDENSRGVSLQSKEAEERIADVPVELTDSAFATVEKKVIIVSVVALCTLILPVLGHIILKYILKKNIEIKRKVDIIDAKFRSTFSSVSSPLSSPIRNESLLPTISPKRLTYTPSTPLNQSCSQLPAVKPNAVVLEAFPFPDLSEKETQDEVEGAGIDMQLSMSQSCENACPNEETVGSPLMFTMK